MEITKDILLANILIVDDESANIVLLERILRRKGFVNIQTTTEPRQVEALCLETDFDVFLIDIRMPHMDGHQLMAMLKAKFYQDDYLPVLVLTAQTDSETRLKALESGAKDFLGKPFDQLEAVVRIKNILEVRLMHQHIKRQNISLEQQVKSRTEELYQTREEVIHRLGLAAEYRDNETGNHIIRMSKYAQLLALAHGMSEQEAIIILNAAPMHDIGKIGIPDNILLKPGKFEPHEWEIMKTHVVIGAKILSGSPSELMNSAYQIALHHHEKWDGSGYPAGLKAAEISIEGRICAIADVFDALTSVRPYKEAWSIDRALAFIDGESGKHFDPDLTKRLREILPQMLVIKDAFSDVLS